MFDPSIQCVGIVRSYAPKREIVSEDDPANRIYEVISGTVCTCKMLREGRRQISGFYFPGDVFGLENSEKHNVAAQAITEAEVRVIKKRALTALVSSNPEVADQLLAMTARELTRKQDHILSLLSTTAEERIICFLIDMVQRTSPRQDHLIALPMSRLDIADYLGLTIETVSRTLWDLERRGAIKINGYHSIVLNQFAEGRAEELLDLLSGLRVNAPRQKRNWKGGLSLPKGKLRHYSYLASLSRWGERARS